MWTKLFLSFLLAITSVTPAHGQIFGRRDRTETKSGPLCTYPDQYGWVREFNTLVSNGSTDNSELRQRVPNLVPKWETVAAIGNKCDFKAIQNVFISGEWDLNYHTGVWEVSASDVCGPRPTLIFKGFSRSDIDEKTTKRLDYLSSYPFYVPGAMYIGSSDGSLALNEVESTLVFFSALLLRQCGALPDAVDVSARDRVTRVGSPYAYREFYSGSYNPRVARLALVADNAAEAERMLSWTTERNANLAEALRLKEEANARALPMLLAIIVGYALYAPRCAVMTLEGICLRMQ